VQGPPGDLFRPPLTQVKGDLDLYDPDCQRYISLFDTMGIKKNSLKCHNVLVHPSQRCCHCEGNLEWSDFRLAAGGCVR
jgi:hypothetical protein